MVLGGFLNFLCVLRMVPPHLFLECWESFCSFSDFLTVFHTLYIRKFSLLWVCVVKHGLKYGLPGNGVSANRYSYTTWRLEWLWIWHMNNSIFTHFISTRNNQATIYTTFYWHGFVQGMEMFSVYIILLGSQMGIWAVYTGQMKTLWVILPVSVGMDLSVHTCCQYWMEGGWKI